jgi:hypothetical protein
VIDFAGGGQYNGANFLGASSREWKQDIQPLEPQAAAEALAALEPVTFAYRDAPGTHGWGSSRKACLSWSRGRDGRP